MKRQVAWTVLLAGALASTAYAQDEESPASPLPDEGAAAVPPVDPETAAPPAVEDSPKPQEKESGYSEGSPFGKSDYDVEPNPEAIGSDPRSFQIGPTFQTGFPHPINYGIEALVFDFLSFGISTGSFKTDIDPAEIKVANTELHARFHPFGGSFFVGAAYGKQNISGTAEDDVEIASGSGSTKVPTKIDIDIDGNYFTPQIGWFSVYYTGLVLGFELGVQIPVNVSTDVRLNPQGLNALQQNTIIASEDYKDLKKKANDAARILGEKTIPYITLFRIGYLF